MKNKFIDKLNAKIKERDDLVLQGVQLASLAFLIDIYEVLGDRISNKKYRELETNLNDILSRCRAVYEAEGAEMATLMLMKDVEEIRKEKHMDEVKK